MDPRARAQAEAHRHPLDRDRRRGADRHRPGLRVDYSGAQACKALREKGYRVILVNSNLATILTDPQLADAPSLEPITPEIVASRRSAPTRHYHRQ